MAQVPWNKGIPHSEETKRKISLRHKGRCLSPEHRAKLSKSMSGRVMTEEHKAKLRAHLARLRAQGIPPPTFGGKPHKFPKGHKPWNTGMPDNPGLQRIRQLPHGFLGKHHSEETKKKLSLAHMGKHKLFGPDNPVYGTHHTDEWKQKRSLSYSGEGNPMYGVKRAGTYSAEVRYKMGNGGRGKKQSLEFVARRTASLIGKKRSEEMKKRISVAHKASPKCQRLFFKKGKDNPTWAGGKSYELYGENFTKELKDGIRVRDNYTCQLCFAPENGHRFCCHHIDYCKQHTVRENLITLCGTCHRRVNANRLFWEAHFSKIMRLRKLVK